MDSKDLFSHVTCIRRISCSPHVPSPTPRCRRWGRVGAAHSYDVVAEAHVEGRATTYQYDQGGHLTVVIPPGPRGRTGYAYDGYEQVSVVYPANGDELDYGYDAMNRLVEIGQTTAVGYTPLQYNNFDANGNLVGRYFANNGSQFVYDARNQVIEAQYHRRNRFSGS